MWTDPTAGAIIGGGAPHVLNWVHRMLWPKTEGEFEAWSTLEPTLMPILTKQVGAQFMPWTSANEKALADGRTNSVSRLATISGSRSRKNITPDRSPCCAPNMQMWPTSPRSILFWKPQAALPACAAENLNLQQGSRSWKSQSTKPPLLSAPARA